MDVRMESNATATSLALQLAAVTQRLAQQQQHWQKRLQDDPSRFGEVEVAVHHAFQEMADQVVAGLLADVGQQPKLEHDCKKSG